MTTILYDETSNNCKPKPLAVNLTNIPTALTQLRRWVLWRYEFKPDSSKWTKTPYNANVFFDIIEKNQKRASVTEPSTWGTFKLVSDILAAHGNEIDGIGFVLVASDGFLGIDTDNTFGSKNETLLLDLFPCYAERSPSGKGLRMIGRGKLPDNKGRKKDWLELYTNERYLTITGQTIPDHATAVVAVQEPLNRLLAKFFPVAATQKATQSAVRLEDEAIVALLKEQQDGGKFAALWAGDEQALIKLGYTKTEGGYDRSRADSALCGKIGFFTDDFDQIKRIYEASGMDQSKWEPRPAYQRDTINTVLNDTNRARYIAPEKVVAAEDLEDIVSPFDFDFEPENENKEKDTNTGSLVLSLSTIKQRAAILAKSKIWAAERWIQSGKIGLLSGKAKRGKSTCMFDLTASLITGGKWLNLIQCRQMPVLLIDYENEEDYMADNLLPMIAHKGTDWQDVDDMLAVVDPQRIYDVLAPFHIETVIALIEGIKVKTGYSVGQFVIDTARPAFNGLYKEGNWEWSANQVRDALNMAHKVKRETGWGGIVIHHNTKGDNTPSGSGDWEGAVDYSINYDLDLRKLESKLSWIGRQTNPPGTVIYTKEGLRLTGHYTDEAKNQSKLTADEMAKLTIKSCLTSEKQSASQIIVSVQNAWIGDDAPGKNTIRDLLKAMVEGGMIHGEEGPKNSLVYWVE